MRRESRHFALALCLHVHVLHCCWLGAPAHTRRGKALVAVVIFTGLVGFVKILLSHCMGG